MKGTTVVRWIGCAATATVLAACGGDAPAPSGRSLSAPAAAAPAAANQPPQVERVTLDPSEPRAGQDVVARVQALDPDGDAVELQYVWILDGRRVAERGASLQVPEDARKGIAIEVEVTAHDGRLGSEPVVAYTRVANRSPELLGVRVEPVDGLKVGSELVAVAEARDPDGDSVDFRYSWRVNGRPAEADGERFSTAGLARGDEVQVRAVARDGESETPPLDSAPVALGNSAPTITSTPGGATPDGSFHYAVQTRDPDGDRNLRFSLAQGPEGAHIDPVLGEVRWSATRAHVGTHAFEVVVTDGHGGEARQRFEVDVREVPKGPAGGAEGEEPVASIEVSLAPEASPPAAGATPAR
jgi:hypothetical protein